MASTSSCPPFVNAASPTLIHYHGYWVVTALTLCAGDASSVQVDQRESGRFHVMARDKPALQILDKSAFAIGEGRLVLRSWRAAARGATL
jgi:hypothetical protein